MSIYDRVNRNQTYIAADWDGDKDAVAQLKKWNNSDKWALNFYDVHELTQSRDTSQNCSIKSSLATRMGITKKFVLVVGDGTRSRRAGSCQYCAFQYNGVCYHGNHYDSRSYIEYECDQAYSDWRQSKLDIVVLYNSLIVNKEKCPLTLRNVGTHVAMKKYDFFTRQVDWDYTAVKKAINW